MRFKKVKIECHDSNLPVKNGLVAWFLDGKSSDNLIFNKKSKNVKPTRFRKIKV